VKILKSIPIVSFSRIIVICLIALALVLTAIQSAQANVADFIGPTGSGKFGAKVTVLSNGNIVVTDPQYSPGTQVNIGAVYLYDGVTHALISQMTGSTDEDRVGSGGVMELLDGNFVVASPRWNNDGATMAGAATWCSATTGCPATVSAANSLVGSNTNDYVGSNSSVTVSNLTDYNGILPISGSAYLVKSIYWNSSRGAVTPCASGSDVNCVGVVSSTNSLVGTTASDLIGNNVTLIPSGGYVVFSSWWNNGTKASAGAVFPCPASGCKGEATTSNGLYGENASAQVGTGVTLLTGGGFVVGSYNWPATGSDYGAATFCSSVTDSACIGKAISKTNSLSADIANSQVGSEIIAMPNGDYIVRSPQWKLDGDTRLGAVTYCTVTGTTSSCTGQTVSAGNSLIGTQHTDNVGSYITLLSGDAFLVSNNNWHYDTGAVTYCSNGAACMGQTVSSSNSLIGINAGTSYTQTAGADAVGNGGIKVLSDGSYAVSSNNWDPDSATKLNNIGAVTFCPSTGCTGTIDPADSIIGAQAGDRVGNGLISKLLGDAFIITNYSWGNGSALQVGAVTYCSNIAACQNTTVNSSNSLVGDQDKSIDSGNYLSPLVLSNGGYLVGGYSWNNGAETYAGALTWCPSTGCQNMVISTTNSLVGSTTWDYVGAEMKEVGDGYYVARNSSWQNGTIAGAGAVTLCEISTGCSGVITSTNSVLGSVQGMDMSGYYDSNNSFDYDTLNHQLLVGLPMENKVVYFTLTTGDVTISGNAGIGGATLTYENGGTQTATADSSGDYSFDVPFGWSGTVTPSKSGYTFSPASKTYTVFTSDQTGQDYTVTSCTAPGSGTVNWSVAFGSCPSGAKFIIPSGLNVVLDTDISIDEDLEVQSGGTLDPNSKTVTLTGSTAQTLTGNPLTFYRLTINKDAKTNTVTVSGKLRVTKKLTITKGKLISASDYGDVEIAVDGELELTSDITVGGNWTNNGTFTHGNHIVTFDGSALQTIDGANQTPFYDFVVDTNAKVFLTTLPTAANTVTNNGVISQTQTVGASSSVSFLQISADKYQAVDITTDGSNNLGAVTVTVHGNQTQCTSDAGSIDYRNRCFRVTSQNSGTAAMTFYTTAVEDDVNFDKVYQYYPLLSTWVDVGTALCGSSDGEACVAGDADLEAGENHFLIADVEGTPTTIGLLQFGSKATGMQFYLLIATLIIGMICLSVCALIWLRRKSMIGISLFERRKQR
jgi:hypothetical protein